MSGETNSEHDGEGMDRVAEAKTICRAVRERWPMGDAARAKAVATLNQVIQSGKSASVKIKAVRALALLDTINLRAQEEPQPPAPREFHVHANLADADELRTRLSALSARLGFGGVVVEGSAVDATANSERIGGS